MGAAGHHQSGGLRFGDYEVIRYLTAGGMADLYLCRKAGQTSSVVLKRVQQRFLEDERVVAMFRDEGQIGALLHHPNIVRVLEVSESEGYPHIAMEYIEGHDLVEVLRACTAKQLVFPRGIGIGICAQLARGLAYAHELRDGQGRPLDIVHNDISPGNVMLSFRGSVKLVDFGVARARIPLHCPERGVAGKYNYMAPEQIRGEPVDRRGDLFSLGVILYEVTCGRRLFKGRPEAVMQMVLREPVPPPRSLVSDYPAELEAVVMRALARNPADRYASAEALRVDLVAVLARLHERASKHELARFLGRLYENAPALSAEVDPEEDNETVEVANGGPGLVLRILDIEDDLTKEANLNTILGRPDEGIHALASRMVPRMFEEVKGQPLPKGDPERTGLLLPPGQRHRPAEEGLTDYMLGDGKTQAAHRASVQTTKGPATQVVHVRGKRRRYLTRGDRRLILWAIALAVLMLLAAFFIAQC